MVDQLNNSSAGGVVVRELGGMYALPVWSLPFVTAGIVDIETLLALLAGRADSAEPLRGAFQLDAGERVLPLPASQWLGVLGQFQEDRKALGDENGVIGPAGRSELVKPIPKGVYVWLDDFRRWFEVARLSRTHTFRRE